MQPSVCNSFVAFEYATGLDRYPFTKTYVILRIAILDVATSFSCCISRIKGLWLGNMYVTAMLVLFSFGHIAYLIYLSTGIQGAHKTLETLSSLQSSQGYYFL